MDGTIVRRGVSLDQESDQLLNQYAEPSFEGNRSMALRALIRQTIPALLKGIEQPKIELQQNMTR